ncbi:UPF0394 inner membrane protein YeeE-like [Ylistrum balloti]|uniref:UPF0394 inner membrane protein YeeE-like n=1 Tax=Ylistrum balloti TaxID=509963 RepID=UPI002905DB7E|nr:UPF0394 inner membrane protein YeeE-like [Ylistrum balloti]
MSGKISPSNRVSDIHIVEKASMSRRNSSADEFEPESTKTVFREEKEGSTNIGVVVFRLTVASVCGIIFGIAVEKGRVFEPVTIRQQMVFENFIMLKVFLSATAAGQLCFVVLTAIPKTRPYMDNAMRDFICCFSEKGILTSILGPFILGIGMTMAGSCPGMILAQIGAWVPNAIFSLIGVFLGALTYGLLDPFICRLARPKEPYSWSHVHKSLDKPYLLIALPMALMIVVGVALAEHFWPWTKDLASMGRENPDGANIATAVSWPPYVSGTIIGLLQLPLVLVIKDTIGGSSSYVTIVSQWVITDKLAQTFPYLAKRRTGVSNWWQVFFVSFVVVGACLSGVASNTLTTSKGPQLPVALFGGFLLLFGARLGAGCTSGHGLSGMALLAWLSLIGVPAMFAGGISTGFAMQASGALDNYVDYTGAV